MNDKKFRPLETVPIPKNLKISFGNVDRQSSAFKTIRSFFETSKGSADFVGFIEEILTEDILLSGIMQRESLHEGILRYHFEQVGFLGASMDVLNNRVVLLRICGELFAVRRTTANPGNEVASLVEISEPAEDVALQVLDCKAFLKLTQFSYYAPLKVTRPTLLTS